jgi:hypothetical protein
MISAMPMLDAAIANQENDLPRRKPISMLSATNKMTVVIQSPCQPRPHGVHLLAFSSCGDLSLRAKHLFDAAMVAGLHAAPPRRQEPRWCVFLAGGLPKTPYGPLIDAKLAGKLCPLCIWPPTL